MAQDRWKTLKVWQFADDFAVEIYRGTASFPQDEIYALRSQLRRAALSVPTNIVEGYSRTGDRELARFLSIALGSLAETKYLLHFSRRIGYLSDPEYAKMNGISETVGRLLWKFYDRVREDKGSDPRKGSEG